MTRGKRNKNPFNIRRGSSRWLGLSSDQIDKVFVQFSSYKYGVRAGLYLLCRYYFDYGLDTVEKLISRFAPANENATGVYIHRVASAANLLQSNHFDMSLIRLYLISSCICQVESSYTLYWKEFKEAFDLLPGCFKNKFCNYGKSKVN